MTQLNHEHTAHAWVKIADIPARTDVHPVVGILFGQHAPQFAELLAAARGPSARQLTA